MAARRAFCILSGWRLMQIRSAGVAHRRRPALVSLVAAFLCAATAVAFLTGLSLVLPGTRLDHIWELNRSAHAAFAASGRAAGALLWVLALAAAAAATGMLQGRRWAWRLSIALFAINGTGDLVNLLVRGDRIKGVSGLAVAGVFLLLLLRPAVRDFFAEST